MKNNSQNNFLIKIMVIGDSMVGKTCLIRKFVNDECAINHLPTISIDFKLKKVELNGNKIMVQLWDTAG
jgi:small GTP-binding protein